MTKEANEKELGTTLKAGLKAGLRTLADGMKALVSNFSAALDDSPTDKNSDEAELAQLKARQMTTELAARLSELHKAAPYGWEIAEITAYAEVKKDVYVHRGVIAPPSRAEGLQAERPTWFFIARKNDGTNERVTPYQTCEDLCKEEGITENCLRIDSVPVAVRKLQATAGICAFCSVTQNGRWKSRTHGLGVEAKSMQEICAIVESCFVESEVPELKEAPYITAQHSYLPRNIVEEAIDKLRQIIIDQEKNLLLNRGNDAPAQSEWIATSFSVTGANGETIDLHPLGTEPIETALQNTEEDKKLFVQHMAWREGKEQHRKLLADLSKPDASQTVISILGGEAINITRALRVVSEDTIFSIWKEPLATEYSCGVAIVTKQADGKKTVRWEKVFSVSESLLETVCALKVYQSSRRSL